MLATLISAIAPMIITILLGILSGYWHDFNANQASVLNKLVMKYTLPMSLFVGVVATHRNVLFSRIDLFVALVLGITLSYGLTLMILIYVFKNSLAEAGMRALIIAGPAVPFVGPTILGSLFQNDSPLIISISGLALNIVLIPCTIMLISSSNTHEINVLGQLKHSLMQPIVWAPLLGFILVLLGFYLPIDWQGSFHVLGDATGGLALFATGVMLYVNKPLKTRSVMIFSVVRMVVIPIVFFVILLLLNTPAIVTNEATITIGIPSIAVASILANQYHTLEREVVSVISITAAISVITLSTFIVMRSI